MARVSLEEYAQHRAKLGLEVSVAAIRKHIRKGQIKAYRGEGGRIEVDPEIADKEWIENTSASHVRHKREQSMTDTGNADPEEGLTFAQASAIQKNYQAKLAKIEYEQAIKKLIPASEIESEWCKIISSFKSKMMSVPSSVRQRDPTITLAQISIIEDTIRDALTEFADDK